MQESVQMNQGKFYHVFNRGINSCEIFTENENYKYFLQLYDRHITSIADTYAWALMPNHFHFVLQIKAVEGILSLTDLKSAHQYFSNFFNAYSKAFNKRYKRHGSLFERPFRRKLIGSIEHLKEAICYVHANPVHHGFCKHPIEYPWTSYHPMTENRPCMVKRDEVMKLFEGRDSFIKAHNLKFESERYILWEKEILG